MSNSIRGFEVTYPVRVEEALKATVGSKVWFMMVAGPVCCTRDSGLGITMAAEAKQRSWDGMTK